MSTTPHRNPNFAEPIEITEPWASALRDAGLVSPTTGELSLQALHRESGVHASTLSRIISGTTREPRAETLKRIADALNVDFITVAGWINQKRSEFIEWVPPTEAHLMTPREREIISQLIRSMVKNRGEDDGNSHKAA